ncbi:MAG: hypothetical protein KAT68_13065 [Bacteroidales bacterium]|nr:hypothetical protein [Bacteroidales bacterium]
MLNNKTVNIVVILAIVAMFFACSSDNNKGNDIEDSIDEAIDDDNKMANDFNKAKQVFYSLPSPIETVMLIKRAGASFDEGLLNPTESLSNYNTSRARALNLGVYSADLSYASLFDQTQVSIKYMSASKRLAEDLGILDAIDESIIGRLENNVNNRDSVMDIISETFMSSNSFLKENDRSEIAAIILFGGWLEGLYIATELTKTTEANNELIDRIIDQKLSLNTLVSLLEEFQSNEDIKFVLEKINEIKSIYDKIQVISSKIEPITDKESKVTTLKAKTDIFISEEVFDSLCVKVAKIRNEIII